MSYITTEEVHEMLLLQMAARADYEWKLGNINLAVVAMWDGTEPPTYLWRIPNRDARYPFLLINRDGWSQSVPCLSDEKDRTPETAHSVMVGVLHLMKLHDEGQVSV